ncbi:MAG TPA: HAMP domain-containing sensor histidine kinase [Roseiflexaceae bacterium]|nr:HAMP domain-containing sensor histidine kinase [Roseiflexaceae bacterium]
MPNAAAVVICTALYYGAFCTVMPFGIDGNSMALVGFFIPMILLVLLWGNFGAILAIIITTACYGLLLGLQNIGIAGWAPRQFEPLVGMMIQLAVLLFSGVIMLRSQREIAGLSVARQQTNERLKAAQRELAASQRQLEDFTARIVHDLSAPIQVLHAALYHHRDPVAHDQVELLDHYVGQLRAYLSVRSAPVAHRPVDLLPICLAAIDAAQVYADRRNIGVSLDLVAPATTVAGDPTAIRRVLDNLLTNAVNVTPEGGEVLVAVRPTPSGLELAVSDAGPGVADPVAIFEPYMSRAVGERRTGTSLGLGLAIVRELTSAMGGQAAVRSAPGQGSTFSIILPRSEEYAHHSCY